MTNTAAVSKVARCILCKEVFMQRQTVRPSKNVATVVRVKVVWNVSNDETKMSMLSACYGNKCCQLSWLWSVYEVIDNKQQTESFKKMNMESNIKRVMARQDRECVTCQHLLMELVLE
ncbi:hypothetical protein EB796_010610 [Bugula neritina]|uniref:Uncharacterized protein n=1 Tax=Bugula neritina TaxID=10212 RepID=A0A7J7JZE8_BUGNE|nr:hypothetical protein EB796_010610 [Bugula neritina]